MSAAPALTWLPIDSDWRVQLKSWLNDPTPRWQDGIRLANCRLDFVATNMLDSALARLAAKMDQPEPLRLAILGSSTGEHLHGAIRVAALRRGIKAEIYEAPYGQVLQDLSDPASGLAAFAPTTILFRIDAYFLATAGLERIGQFWRMAQERFGCPIIQQTPLPVLLPILGQNEQRLDDSPFARVAKFSHELRALADASGVDLLTLDDRARQDGLAAWHDRALWHRSKQEVRLPAAPVYGDLVMRLIAARQGRSAKCLVLDLDNTLWGGVVGDDGLSGLVLGQGDPAGEAYLAIQDHAKHLARRGVILAICSKNDLKNAEEPFLSHPDMRLKREDIACFIANWQDKATNLRSIAQQLNIGLDSLVFLDDNPMERDLVRSALPMVMVPEFPEDPALVPQILAESGYFEAVRVTDEDRQRGKLYQDNQARSALAESATDLPAYLRGLAMTLSWRRFDELTLPRVAQLINKTNQFNLTTRRLTEDEVRVLMQDPSSIGLSFRLTDRFGDNGIIAVVTLRRDDVNFVIEDWLMSCRVLGRQVEQATLSVLTALCRAAGGRKLIGLYRPTARNAMVKNHYADLGFHPSGAGSARYELDLGLAPAIETFLTVTEESVHD